VVYLVLRTVILGGEIRSCICRQGNLLEGVDRQARFNVLSTCEKVIMKKNNNELFPEENILTKEIESWKDFADSLNSQEYKELFNKMLNDCYKYAKAINAKEKEPFPNTTESLIMALRQQL
jgi:hypothetical protein